eukprot:s5067_g4.t1
MIEMGAAAGPKLLKEAAEAHHKAIGSISGPNGVTSRADWDSVIAALGRVVASVPKEKVMAVYDSVKDITDPKVPAYMKSLVKAEDAEKAYKGFLEFKDVVAKNQVAKAGSSQCPIRGRHRHCSQGPLQLLVSFLEGGGLAERHLPEAAAGQDCAADSET